MRHHVVAAAAYAKFAHDRWVRAPHDLHDLAMDAAAVAAF